MPKINNRFKILYGRVSEFTWWKLRHKSHCYSPQGTSDKHRKPTPITPEFLLIPLQLNTSKSQLLFYNLSYCEGSNSVTLSQVGGARARARARSLASGPYGFLLPSGVDLMGALLRSFRSKSLPCLPPVAPSNSPRRKTATQYLSQNPRKNND